MRCGGNNDLFLFAPQKKHNTFLLVACVKYKRGNFIVDEKLPLLSYGKAELCGSYCRSMFCRFKFALLNFVSDRGCHKQSRIRANDHT